MVCHLSTTSEATHRYMYVNHTVSNILYIIKVWRSSPTFSCLACACVNGYKQKDYCQSSLVPRLLPVRTTKNCKRRSWVGHGNEATAKESVSHITIYAHHCHWPTLTSWITVQHSGYIVIWITVIQTPLLSQHFSLVNHAQIAWEQIWASVHSTDIGGDHWS